MKVCKFRIAVLVLLVPTIIYGFTLALSAWHYHSWLIQKTAELEAKGFMVNPESFFTTSGGQHFMAGVVLAASWVVLLNLREWKAGKKPKLALGKSSRKTMLALTLLFPLILPTFSLINAVSGGQSAPLIRVGVLCAGDEEFMEDPANVGRVESAIRHANSAQAWAVKHCFELTYGVHFEVVTWVTWESNNNVHDARLMIYEVWTDTGFETGKVYNGKIVDMLYACTGQDIEGYWAVTAPDMNITLAKYPAYGLPKVVRHELSHQLGHLYECGAWCVMDPNLFKPHDWCEYCFQGVNSHKFRFTVVGDVNGDYKVDIRDVSAAATSYGSVRGEENFYPSCDIDGNDVINIIDLNTIASHFGESRY